ncbi:MAG TPA: DUF2161 family putative PD-(D/E)XK-type phosphodiesterase [Armatimonadota bacterium]|nr:DUF2161 family putative PD-(D/E)XK-type phosphodiesterase [Armatimonadota bacterium]
MTIYREPKKLLIAELVIVYDLSTMAKEPAKAVSETELYRPICDYLTNLGYTVRGEVRDCDITAIKGDDLIIIEMKRTLNIALLIQAVKRQRVTDSVYIAVPYPKKSGIYTAEWKGIKHLLRRLELGLIFVSLNSKPSVQIVFHPLPFDRKKRRKVRSAIIQEIESRSGDYNEGGSSRKKVVTAYRENAIHIACCLDRFGPLAPRQLRDLGTGPKTLSILSSNFYGWFERVDRGVYGLKPEGRTALSEFTEAVDHYRTVVSQIDCPQ